MPTVTRARGSFPSFDTPELLNATQRTQLRTNTGLVDTEDLRLLQVVDNASTGVVSFASPLLSINADPTKFNVGSLVASFATGDTLTRVAFTGATAVTDLHLTTADLTFVYLDSGGVLRQSATPLTNTQHRQYAFLGVMGHGNRVTQGTANATPTLVDRATCQTHDLMRALGMFNLTGNAVFPNGANLSIGRAAGSVFSVSSNAATDLHDPHVKVTAGVNPAGFFYATQLAPIAGVATALTTTEYDVGGVMTTFANNRWQNFRVFMAANGTLLIQPGQATYSTLDVARDSIFAEAFVLNPSINNLVSTGQAILRCVISVKKGETDLSSSDTFFTDVGRFGTAAGGVATAPTTLQGTYLNSAIPQIQVDDAHGELTIQNARALDTSTVQAWRNILGTITASLTGEGRFSALSYNTPDGRLSVTPVGTTASFAPYTTGYTPAGWLYCDGQAVSRTTYADLFALIGTTFGVGDGSTTFNLPNLEGEFTLPFCIKF